MIFVRSWTRHAVGATDTRLVLDVMRCTRKDTLQRSVICCENCVRFLVTRTLCVYRFQKLEKLGTPAVPAIPLDPALACLKMALRSPILFSVGYGGGSSQRPQGGDELGGGLAGLAWQIAERREAGRIQR